MTCMEHAELGIYCQKRATLLLHSKEGITVQLVSTHGLFSVLQGVTDKELDGIIQLLDQSFTEGRLLFHELNEHLVVANKVVVLLLKVFQQCTCILF